MSAAGVAMLAVSAGLMAGTALLASRGLARTWGDRFWVFVGAVSAQLGTVAVLTSLVGAYAPWSYLAVQSAAFAGAMWAYRRWGRREGGVPGPLGGNGLHSGSRWAWGIGARAMILCAAVLVAISMAEQIVTPVRGYDEGMYNCSRTIYWMQHRSILPFESHNEAHVDMPIGAELYFGWAVLLTREELWGRIAVWLGFPVAVIGAYLLARRVGAGRTGGAAASLIFAATPTVLHIAGNAQKQDIWNAAFALGTGYWVARAARGRSLRPFAMAGFFLLLAINAKTTSLTMLPFVVGVCLLPRRGRGLLRRCGAAAAGMAAGLVLSGLIVPVGSNLLQYGSPLGSKGLRNVAQPDMTLKQIWTHTVRAPVFLMEAPEHVTEGTREALADLRAGTLERLGAEGLLPQESTTGWPGHFDVFVPQYARYYSLGGPFWLAMLVAGAGLGVWRLWRRWPRVNPAPVVWVLAMSGAYLVGLVYLLRWVNGTWDRYWLGAYALGIAGGTAVAWRCLRRRPWAAGVAALMVAAMVYPSMRQQIARTDQTTRAPRRPELTDRPFAEVVPHLAPGSKLLLVCGRSARDYPLFLPRQGYSCEVHPWGTREFDAARMERMVEELGITHLLIENDRAVGFHWRGGLATREMAAWAAQREGFVQVPLQTARMRLFRRGSEPTPADAELPAFHGFTVLEGLANAEGPFPDAALPRVRWGLGERTRLSVQGRAGPMLLRLECRRNTSPDQAMTVRINGKELARHVFTAPRVFESIEVEFQATEGANEIILEYASVEGDRWLAVLFRKIQVVAK